MNRLLDQQFVRGKQFVRDLTPGQNIGPRTNNLETDCIFDLGDVAAWLNAGNVVKDACGT